MQPEFYDGLLSAVDQQLIQKKHPGNGSRNTAMRTITAHITPHDTTKKKMRLLRVTNDRRLN